MTNEHREASLIDRIQETVERTATNVEEIHKAIAEAPLDVMRHSGLFEQTSDDVSELQERAIGAVYDAVRDISRRVTGLASDLLQPPAGDAETASE